jgi:hypothetical protein
MHRFEEHGIGSRIDLQLGLEEAAAAEGSEITTTNKLQ